MEMYGPTVPMSPEVLEKIEDTILTLYKDHYGRPPVRGTTMMTTLELLPGPARLEAIQSYRPKSAMVVN